MCDTANDQDPRAALAETIRRKTDNGNDVVDYLLDVLHQRLDGVKHLHRERAAGILTEYGDLGAIRFIEENRKNKRADRPAKRQTREEREDTGFNNALAQVIRDKTNGAGDIADYLIDTMNGIDSAIGSGLGKIAHRHRVAAAIELLRRGYPPECDCAHRAASDNDQTVARDTAPTTETHDSTANKAHNPEEETNIEEILAKLDRIIEETDPSEFDDDDDSDHKPDYSMWEIIRNQPEPVITEEQARIGAAQFHEAVERQMRWAESNVKIPTRKDHHNYDDG